MAKIISPRVQVAQMAHDEVAKLQQRSALNRREKSKLAVELSQHLLTPSERKLIGFPPTGAPLYRLSATAFGATAITLSTIGMAAGFGPIGMSIMGALATCASVVAGTSKANQAQNRVLKEAKEIVEQAAAALRK